MPFRLTEHRAKIQFITNASMPNDIYKACVKTGTVSNTVYIQRAVCEALSRDLGVPLETLLAELPEPRGPSAHLFNPAKSDKPSVIPARVGPANTVESVR